MAISFDFDYVVIGSGFGGSVSALRLSEKGYKVGVFEMGKRYQPKDFPKSNWNLKKFLWAPSFGFHGIFRMSLFRHVWALSGVGVGGGSLVYANTLLVPPKEVWKDSDWANLENWGDVMPKYYDQAKKMLGVNRNPHLADADLALKKAAEKQGLEESYYATDVGIFFGEAGKKVPDPYFNGKGPERTGCTFCGACMIGCRDGGKNTLDKNYLYLAEKEGAKVLPETKVVDVIPLNGKADGSDGYEIHTVCSTSLFKRKKVWYSKGVVFSAGVLGTVRLLLQLKQNKSLPALSERLGHFVRTNAEALLGVETSDKNIDMSKGVAIGSGVYLDEETHIEAVRYPKNSDALGLVSTPLVGGESYFRRILNWMAYGVTHPIRFLRPLLPKGFAKKSVILLVMQTVDLKINFTLSRPLWWPFSKKFQSTGQKIPSHIPKANEFARKMAKEVNGVPKTSLTEMLFDVPSTAHMLGGAAMGATDKEGVIDANNKVFNYQNMYVCDGSMIAANLGVNPSLTITALTERAMNNIKARDLEEEKEGGEVVGI
ncbi:GMC family oxidoreductase [Cytophagales bacterium RKSG123]|nr:GMC oxidoreductase [Xanthovirga aplysinae]MTI29533.1 GMC family oxidoreductase [Xanthovirga aplysinae]